MPSPEAILLQKFRDDPQCTRRVQELYLPVLNWTKSQILPDRPAIIGVNGPQGCGKSTLCQAICEVSNLAGFRAAALSIDDFYFTRTAQNALAKKFPNNPYLQKRGYPGTHDIALGTKILLQIKKLKYEGEVECPVYDKSAFQGWGDRFPPTEWKKIRGPLDILLFEGWMLGFSPVPESLLTDGSLIQINRFLEDYRPWVANLDALLQIEPLGVDYTVHWRMEAEKKQRDSGRGGMSEAETRSYIETFLPAYSTYLPLFAKGLPPKLRVSKIQIELDRLPPP